MKHVTLDGLYIEVFETHIILLNHFKIPNERVNFVKFIRFSMGILMAKCKNKPTFVPLHQAIMLLIYQKIFGEPDPSWSSKLSKVE